MELEQLNKYKIDENSVISISDKKHIENYKQLITFFENAINNSIIEGKADYNVLNSSLIQCIRYLDNLIYTYDMTLKNVMANNQLIEKIIKNNTPLNESEKLGNEKDYEKPM